jgi:hypothetical protein
MLRCSEWWVKEQARRRRIPFCWIGGSYLFTEEHIAAIVSLFEVQPIVSAAPTPGASHAPRAARVAESVSGGALRLHARPPRRARGSRQSAA